jgi:signal transduction histidine kinase
MSQLSSIAHIGRSVDQSKTSPRLQGVWLKAARWGWVVLAATALGILITSLPGYALRFSGGASHATVDTTSTSNIFFSVASGIASLATALLSLGLAWMLFRRRFEEPAAAALSFYLLVYAVLMAGPLEHWSVYWLGTLEYAWLIQGILLATPTVALFAVFPNGHFIPAWMRWVVLSTLPWILVLFWMPSYSPAAYEEQPILYVLMVVWYVSFYVLGIYAQVHRFRRVSTPSERQQTKWVIYGFALWFAYILISTGPFFYSTSLPSGSPEPWWLPLSELGWFLSLAIVPVSLTIAITRNRLWDIDLVINRTLVYSALTACVVALYVLVIGGLGLLFQTSNNYLIPLLATGLAAVLFQPLRQRLQSAVNRMMYGERDDPVAVLSKLGRQLEGTVSPLEALSGIVETVAMTLKLPYAAIEIGMGDTLQVITSFGKPPEDRIRFPITYQTENIGFLTVAPRSPGEGFSEVDITLIENIALQTGALAQAAKLTADLKRSRQELVMAREEERRRLRRDLHDGLGPQLASQTLILDALEKRIQQDPASATRLLHDLKKQSQDAIKDIRQLVYDLRPPALDELGLEGAVREFAEAQRPGGLEIEVTAKTPISQLPAAVEVAAYRIIQEAVTNVSRHANAQKCEVFLSFVDQDGQKQLRIEIDDDGIGIQDDQSTGVGLQSMRERAEELGGYFTIEPRKNTGTCAIAVLPFPEDD